MSEIDNPDRFADLRGDVAPDACRMCSQKESQGQRSYRQLFIDKSTASTGIQFVDFRHSNQCNLKCRYCNPHFSNQWARELGYEKTLISAPVEHYYESLLTDNLVDLYWCGEPLIIKEHYDVLQRLIDQGKSKNIELRYNTNLTVIQYKNIDLLELWANFKSVSLHVSLDAAGHELNYIRSGSSWETISDNIDIVSNSRSRLPNLYIDFAVTVSMLNIWFLPELYAYAQTKQIPVKLNVLQGPDYLSLAALYTEELKDLAMAKLNQIKQFVDPPLFNSLLMMGAADNEYLFAHAVRHILLLDNVRGENLFKLLPFTDTALTLTAKNNEYE
jgi:organic radical activating enzyme